MPVHHYNKVRFALIFNLFYEFSINHVSDANMSELDAIIAAVNNDVNNNYDEKKYKRNAKVWIS